VLAWEEIKKSKGKYALITLIMVLIIYLVLFIIGLALGLQDLAASKISDSQAQTYVLEEGATDSLDNSRIELTDAKDILNDLDGEEAFLLRERLGNIVREGGGNEQLGVSFFGLEDEDFMYPEVIEGRLPEAEDEIIASMPLKNEGVKLNDTVTVSEMEESFTVVGFSEDETYNYSPILYLSPEQFEQVNIAMAGEEDTPVQAVVSTLPAEDINIAEDDYGVELSTQNELVMATPGYTAQNATFLLMIVFMYIISTFILAVFFYVITIQKIPQYGQLKAIGAKNGFLARTIISQVGIIVLMGALISVGLTFGTAFILPSSVPFRLEPVFILGGSAIFLIFALIGSLFSLIKVAKVDPVVAIGGNN